MRTYKYKHSTSANECGVIAVLKESENSVSGFCISENPEIEDKESILKCECGGVFEEVLKYKTDEKTKKPILVIDGHEFNSKDYNKLRKYILYQNLPDYKDDSWVDKAIRDMPEDFEIRHFLKEHQSEVKSMCITEYDEAETMQMFKEEGREEGRLEGREEARIQLIEDMLRRGKSVEEIVDFCRYPTELVKKIAGELLGKV